MNREKIGLLLLGLVTLAMFVTGTFKIVGAEEAAKAFGNDSAPYILAITEFLTAVALLLPRTRLLGVILAASYLGGATAFAWLAGNEVPGASLALLVILYVGAALYRPALTDNHGTSEFLS